MKKCLILSLALALLFGLGASALAADVKVGGEVRYVLTVPADDEGYGPDWSTQIQFRLKAIATLNEQTDALIQMRFKPDEAKFTNDKLFYAELNTKFAGLGKLRLGRVESGSSPFANFGNLWGAQDGSDGIAFVTEKAAGLGADLFIAPAKDEATWAGEVTYDLPMLEGATLGVAFNKIPDNEEVDYALIANLPLNETFSVYGEFGKMDDSDEMNVQNVGTAIKLGTATVYAEGDLKGERYYLQGTVPFQGVSLNASYQFGNGYKRDADSYEDPNCGEDGKFTVWAKVVF